MQISLEAVKVRMSFQVARANDTISGGDGNDTIDGGAGDDTINDGLGDDVIDAGEGRHMTRSLEILIPLIPGETWVPHIDLVNQGLFSHNFPGFRGDVLKNFENVIIEGSFNVMVTGDDQDNKIMTGSGNDAIVGGAGNDWIYAGDGDDTVSGNDGNDMIFASFGNDFEDGGAGTDTLVVGGFATQFTDVTFNLETGGSYVSGQTPNTAKFANFENFLVGMDFDGNRVGSNWNFTVYGTSENNSIQTSHGDDTIDGGAGNDFLDSGAGNDTIVGGAGDDFIDGGHGDDTLKSTGGFDRLFSDEGNDKFINENPDQLPEIAFYNTSAKNIEIRLDEGWIDDGLGGRDEIVGNFKIHTGDHDSVTIFGNNENNQIYLGGGIGTANVSVVAGEGYDHLEFGSNPLRGLDFVVVDKGSENFDIIFTNTDGLETTTWTTSFSTDLEALTFQKSSWDLNYTIDLSDNSELGSEIDDTITGSMGDDFFIRFCW